MLSRGKTEDSLLEADVYTNEPLGSEVIIDLKIDDNLIKANVPLDLSPDPGNNVWASINTKEIHVLDQKSQKTVF